MNELIYGTTNPAKVAQVRDVLEPLGLSIKSLADFAKLATADEDGATAEENARQKAVVYAKELNEPVLSMDVALYFNDLPDDQQPGLHVRRIKGSERPSDDEVLAYYTDLAARLDDKLEGYWRYAFALARPDGSCVSFTHDTPRRFVSRPSTQIVEGFPLGSLQIDPASGHYISEMLPAERVAFWRNSIGVPLAKFVRANY